MEGFPVCTQCGFTWGEYRARGLAGCAQCYLSFGEAMQADVAWLHGALALSDPDPEPASPGPGRPGAPDPESLARWREQIAEAVRAENYEEAARLNRLILGGGASLGPGLGLA